VRTLTRSLALRVAAAFLALAGLGGLAGCGVSAAATAGPGSGKPVLGIAIGFSNNTWNEAMIHEVNAAVGSLQAQGKLGGVKIANANNDVSTQVSQIENMILEGVSAIVVQPTSTAGLNGVIGAAERAHVPVLVIAEGPVTTNQPYELESNFSGGQEQRAEYILNRMGGHGNVLNIRGTAGTGADEGFQAGTEAALKKYPGIKVVDTVYGDWDDSITQSAVAQALPGLPSIQGVIGQGGEEYGAVQAISAAGHAIPITDGGNRTNFLQWWQSQHAKTGYTTISSEMDPGIGAAGVYEGYEIAKGIKVPKLANFPYLTIPQSQLAHYIATSESVGCAFTNPSYAYVASHLGSWGCTSNNACGWTS
jgi:ribose transport system substrate-binding protein